MKTYIVAAIIVMAAIGNVSISGASTANDCQQKECFDLKNIDCNNVTYSADWTFNKTLAVMKFCTGGEKEVD